MSIAGQRVAVLIPARNESQTVRAVVEAVRKVDSRWSIFVVDDQSTDATALAARSAGATVLSTSPRMFGLGAAMNLGIQTAMSAGYNTFMTIDADGQYTPADLRDLLAEYRASGVDLVIGSRVANGRPQGMKSMRHKLNRAFSRWYSDILGLDEEVDSQSGMRVFGRRVASECLVNNSYTYTLEQLLRARLLGLSVASVPVGFNARRHGRSRLISSAGSYAKRTLPGLMRVYLKHRFGSILDMIWVRFGDTRKVSGI